MFLQPLIEWFRNVWNLKKLLALNEQQAFLLREQDKLLMERKRSLRHCEVKIANQRQKLSWLMDPAATPICGKIRLRDRAEAEAMGKELETESWGGRFKARPYPCNKCPRHPFTLEKYWHVARDRSSGQRRRAPSAHSQRADAVVEQREYRKRIARNARAQELGVPEVPLVADDALDRLKERFNNDE